MTSIIKVDNIQDSTGNAAIAIDSSGNVTMSGHTDLSKFAGSDVSMNTKSSHTFSNIPAVYNRLTLLVSGLSGSGTAEIQIQLGTSGGIVTTGYWNRDAYASNGGTWQTALSTNNDSFTLANWTGASNAFSGYWCFHHIGNTWFSNISGAYRSGNNNYYIEQFGQIDLSDTLTQIKVSIASGTFDAGSINLLYG